MGKTVINTAVIKINDKEVKNSFYGINSEVRKLQRDLKKLTPGTEEFKKKSAELKVAKEHFEKVKNEINGVSSHLNEASKSVSGFKAVFTGNVAADFFMGTVSALREFGISVQARIEDLINVKRVLSQLDDSLKGVSLNKAASSVQAIADTYNKSVEEIQNAVKGLNAQTHDTNKSLELIKKGFEVGADASGEMLAQLKEYPSLMNDAKVSAEEMVAIMAHAEKSGVYDDKGIDAIKEGMLRIREGTKATTEAMKALGINVDKLYADINSGSITYFDAMKMVSNKLKEVGADSKVTGTAIADIFGGPGEDASYEYLSTLGEINTNLDDLTTQTNTYALAKSAEVEANEKLNNIWVGLTDTGSALNLMYTQMKSGLADILSNLLNIKKAKISDEYLAQANKLDFLAIKLENVNTSKKEKIRIINQLKTEFPNYFKNLDIEKAKYNDIALAVRSAANEMRKKYQLQSLNEALEEKGEGLKKASSQVNLHTRRAEEIMAQYINDIPALKNLKYTRTDTNGMMAEMVNFLKANPNIQGNSNTKTWDLAKNQKVLNEAIKLQNTENDILKKEIEFRQRRMKQLGLYDVELDNGDSGSDSNSGSNSTSSSGSGSSSGVGKLKSKSTSTTSAAEKRKKELEQIAKAEKEAYQKRMEALFEFQEEQAKAIDDDYKREVELEVARRNKEEFKHNTNVKSIAEKKDNSKSKQEQDELQKQLDILNQIEQLNEETHQQKLLAIQQKYDAKMFEAFVNAEQKRLEKGRMSREEAILEITTLSQAKQELSNMQHLKLTDQELESIKSLEDAKRALREDADRELLKAQLESLENQKQQLEAMLEGMTGEAAEKLKENLDSLHAKIVQVKSAIQSGEESDQKKVTDEDRAKKGSVDLLGYSVQDWEDMWANLDTTEGKLKAVIAVTQAMGNAAKMYADLVDKLGQKEIRKFEKNQSDKKKKLLKELNEGYINQEQYHKQLELLEADLANKKAEIAYKVAKARKAADIMSAISGTATAVIGALGNQPWTPANFALAGIVGALGAVQIATIAAQPLPPKQSFAVGGFTGPGIGSADSTGFKPAGIVHEGEYVTPSWMLEEPIVADVVNWMESIRIGRTKLPKTYAEGGYTEPTSNTNSSIDNSSNNEMILVLKDVKSVLEDLKTNGVDAYMIEDAENGKKIHQAIKQYLKIENRNANPTE